MAHNSLLMYTFKEACKIVPRTSPLEGATAYLVISSNFK